MPTANLTLQVQSGTDVLHRVVCVCRRRNLQLLALSYSDQRISLTVRGDDRQMRGIERWLLALLEVFEVEREELSTLSEEPYTLSRRASCEPSASRLTKH